MVYSKYINMEFSFSIVDLINIFIITIGIGVCVMCFLHITTSENLKQKKTFRLYFQLFFIFLALNISSHLVRQVLEGQPGQGMHIFLTIMPCLEGIFVSLLPYMMALLLLTIVKTTFKQRIEIALHVLLFLQIVATIILSARGLAYYFDANNIYHRGSLYIVTNLTPAIMIIMCMALLLFFGRRIGTLVKIAFWVFLVTPLIGIVITSFSYGIQYVVIATVGSSVFMYFAILQEQAEQYRRQNDAITKLQNGLILVLADLVESRDKCTGDHIKKTAEYVQIIMNQLILDNVYAEQLTDSFVEDVVRSAPLHDIGKIQVPDAILNKPGRLTPNEFEIIKTHTTAGRDIITSAINMVAEEDSGYLYEARNLAYCHHEKWNGSGYPQGLKGEEIPLSARIMAVADVFDALVSRRSYKEPFTFEQAMDIIKESSGTHFDPKIVDAFIKAEPKIRQVVSPS